MAKNFKITFSPLVANNIAQVATIATVSLLNDDILWEEPIIIAVKEGMTIEDVDQVVENSTTGFAARVNAILVAKEFEGRIPIVT